MRDLSGKTYWLIGASEGLGRALAQKLSRAGADLVLSARSRDRLGALSDALPGRSRVVPLDVRDALALRAAAGEISRIDGLLYVSGVLHPMRAHDWDTAALREMLDVNLIGAIEATGAVLPGMIQRGAGHIVYIGSLAAYRGLPGYLGYGASKAGLYSLAESMRADLQDSGIDVQIAHPGYIRTRMTATAKGPMPGLLEAESAAQRVLDLMQSDRFARCFPLLTGFGAQALQMVPDWLYFAVAGRKN